MRNRCHIYSLYWSAIAGPPQTLCEENGVKMQLTESDFTPQEEPIKYGLLYNRFVVTDLRKITSSDNWYIPSQTESDALRNYVGGFDVAGGELKETGLTHWLSPNTGATNSVGFNARGAGRRYWVDGIFMEFKEYVSFWTSTLDFSDRYRVFIISYDSDNFSRMGFPPNWGISVRFVSNATGVPDGTTTTYTGNDGKVYLAVAINGLYWTTVNIVETKYRTGDIIPEVTDNTTWSNLTTGALCAYNNDWNNVGRAKPAYYN